jgi:tetratricopeptide (TPR) repeat protein
MEECRGGPARTRRTVKIAMAVPPLLKRWPIALRGRPAVTLSLLLMVGTLIVFWPLGHAEFINYDDNVYVSNNPHLRDGLTWKGVQWALSSDFMTDAQHTDYWIPVTFLSHLLVADLFGLEPAAHHLVNAWLHALNTVLLFLLLQRMTGALWRSAVVAAVFAVHPLHVESVAWVTERKDVLSGLFFMLTLLAYVRYVERSTLSRYLLVVLAFALGLMSKPMLVTTPFLLMLLDYWPLGRFSLLELVESGGWSGLRAVWRSAREKLPLFALSAGATVITYLATQREATVASFQELPLTARLENALVSYAGYIRKMLWPDGLAVFYPYPRDGVPAWQVIGAALVLMCLSALVVRGRRTRPYAIMGWFWYLGALLPVIGLLQAGGQAMADRYTYIPLIGLFIMVAWGLPDLLATWRYRQAFLSVAAVGSIAACIVLTRGDLRYWRTSATLFEHALKVTEDNYVAYNNLGLALAEEGKFQEAIHYYRQALLIWPEFPAVRYNIGNALAHEGRDDEAIWHYSQVLQTRPNDDMAHNNLGMVLGNQGKFDEAIGHFTEALRINPDLPLVHNNLGLALAKQGHYDAALGHFTDALRLEPRGPAHNNLGMVLGNQGKLDEAIGHFTEALRINPDQALMHNNLGLALAKQGKFNDAIAHFTDAIRLEPPKPDAHYNLGVVYSQLGRVDEAIRELELVLTLNPQYPNARKSLDLAVQKKGGRARQ